MIDFEEPDIDINLITLLIWLKTYRWTALFDWNTERNLRRRKCIVRRLFPDGISQSDFMKIKKSESALRE